MQSSAFPDDQAKTKVTDDLDYSRSGALTTDHWAAEVT